MGWVFGLLVSVGFLYFGGAQIQAVLVERGPTSLSCREFLERGSSARWVWLHDCRLDWAHARESQATRYRKALFVPATSPDRRSQRQLFIRVFPDDVDRTRTTWGGMLDTPSVDSIPDFANGPSAHILYPNRPGVWEMVLAVVPALLFVTAATRARRRAARQADALRHLRTRFPIAHDSSRVAFVDLDGVVRASRVVVIAVLLAVVPTTFASVAVALSTTRAAAIAWSITALLAAASIAIAGYGHRLSLDDRLLIVGRAALVGSAAIVVPLCLVMGGLEPALAALPLLLSAVISMRARRRLLAATSALVMTLVRATRLERQKRVWHSSIGRRPVRVVLYRVSAIAVAGVGVLTRVVTGTSVLLWIAGAAAIVLWNRGSRHAAFDAATVMERDPRPPVLLLRSFGDDGLEAKGTSPLPWSYAQTLAFVAAMRLQVLGPVVAIAPPHERLPPLGPYRVFVRKGDWRAEVDALIARARALVLFLGFSEGVLWEFRRLMDGERAGDLMLVVPPAEPASLEKRWEALIEVTQDHPAWDVVSTLDPLSTLLIKRLTDDRLVVFRGAHRNAAYDWAFQLCAASRYVPGENLVA
jgi:hypothetical protein